MALLRPAPSAKPGERIAVFGFTPSDSDPQSAELAAAATDETFKSMSLMRLDVVARGETQGTPADQRLARAKELGAHYAVSGEASGPPDRTGRVTLRIEDVPSRTTLWETSINEVHFPAIQSGATSTLMLECIARDRTHLPEADPDTTRLIATACRVWSAIGDLALALPARRELAARNPRNPHFAAELAFALGVFELTPNPERVAEMRAAIEAARALAPDSPALAAAEWRYGAYTGKRLAGSQAPLDRWLKGGDVDDTVVGTRLLRFLGNHLGRTGRINDALKAFTDAEGLRPVSEPASFTTLRARMLAQRGAMRQADDLYRLAYARSGNATVWHWWLDDALVLGVGDPETIVRLAPAGGRADATQCWERIVELWSAGQKMSGLQHAIACNQAGNLNADHVLILSAHLGQTDLAFRHLDFVATTPVVAYWLFSPATRPLRTEKRFLAEIQQLGLWDYWLETQTQPDVCLTKEEKGFPVCVELEKALAEKAASASAAPAPTKP
jgi:TolB-like protein